MRKLKPSTTFENPSYSEVESSIRLKKSCCLSWGWLRPSVSPPADERWETREERQRRRCLRLRAVAICPGRQVPEEGSIERLLPDWGHFQRHSQPGERGQRRITSLSQQESQESKTMKREKKQKQTLCTEFIFLCSLCTNLNVVKGREIHFYRIEEWERVYVRDFAFWLSDANSCVDVFFILMYDMYIFALKLLIEMLISCIFVNLNCENLSENILQ